VVFLLVSFHSILANIFARQALIKPYLIQLVSSHNSKPCCDESFITRVMVPSQRQRPWIQTNKLFTAATRIQATWRGVRTRKRTVELPRDAYLLLCAEEERVLWGTWRGPSSYSSIIFGHVGSAPPRPMLHLPRHFPSPVAAPLKTFLALRSTAELEQELRNVRAQISISMQGT
jgi:hypothetical protein